MHHFLLIDKPASWTSFDVVAVCRRIFHEKRVGHSGTLDPFATGLLVLGLGSATKELFRLPCEPKVYEGMALFGATSSTGDPEGEISFAFDADSLSPDMNKKMNQDTINKIIHERFLGDIDQVPPAYSAKKVGGVPAYKRARRGEDVSLSSRRVHIFSFSLLSCTSEIFSGHPVWRASFVAEVSSGTYLRSLIRDLGEALGTSAYTVALRRTRMGTVSVENAVTPDFLRTCDDPQRFLIEASSFAR